MQRLEKYMTGLENSLSDLENSILKLKDSKDSSQQQIMLQLEKSMWKLGNSIGELDSSLCDLDNSMDELDKSMRELENHLDRLEDYLEEQNMPISERASTANSEQGITGTINISDFDKCINISNTKCTGFENCVNQTCTLWNSIKDEALYILSFDSLACDYQFNIEVNDLTPVVITGMNTTSCDWAIGPYVCSSYQCILDSICLIQKLGHKSLIEFPTFPTVCNY